MLADVVHIRGAIDPDVFDYTALSTVLSAYRRPRDKASLLVEKGHIQRIRNGLYMFAAPLRRRLTSKPEIANLIYGPSYVSLEYALAWHGMIPEAVVEVTSVTTGRSRRFDTPLGAFSYRRIPLAAFACGMERIELKDGTRFLMASPEKALADTVVSIKDADLRSVRNAIVLLTEDLRIDEEELARLDLVGFRRIADLYGSRKLRYIADAIRELTHEGGR